MPKERAEQRSCYVEYLEGKTPCASDNSSFQKPYSPKISCSPCNVNMCKGLEIKERVGIKARVCTLGLFLYSQPWASGSSFHSLTSFLQADGKSISFQFWPWRGPVACYLSKKKKKRINFLLQRLIYSNSWQFKTLGCFKHFHLWHC